MNTTHDPRTCEASVPCYDCEHPEPIVKAFDCPLCIEGEVVHHTQTVSVAVYPHEGQTHIYVCDSCPFVALEYHLDGDYKALGEFLNR